MSLQFEDVVDCLQVLYPEFDVMILFDHGQGHARKQPGALNAFQMSKTYGGAQARQSLSHKGYLGAHLPCLNGQPKGLFQVLWERGLILEHSFEKYTLDGRKNAITGIVDLHYSLQNLLAECTGFKEEDTAVQYLGTQLEVTGHIRCSSLQSFMPSQPVRGLSTVGRMRRHIIVVFQSLEREDVKISKIW
jgi:hypothetical protein